MAGCSGFMGGLLGSVVIGIVVGLVAGILTQSETVMIGAAILSGLLSSFVVVPSTIRSNIRTVQKRKDFAEWYKRTNFRNL